MTAPNVDALQAMLDEFVKETSPDFDRIDFLNCLVRAYGEVTTFNEEIQHHFDAPELRGMGLMCESMLDHLVTNFQIYWPPTNDNETFS